MKKSFVALLFFIPTFFSCISASIAPNKNGDTINSSVKTTNDCNFDTNISMNLGNVLSKTEQNQFYEIWKKEFISSNNFSESFFMAHINKYEISSFSWNAGTTFRIDYLMDYGWASIHCTDQFVVKMNADYDYYRQENIPRNVLLANNYIKTLLDKNIESTITKIKPYESLKFNSCADIINFLKSKSKYTTISLDRILYNFNVKEISKKGDPYITIKGVIDANTNKCINGYINIYTGEFEIYENVCVIYN